MTKKTTLGISLLVSPATDASLRVLAILDDRSYAAIIRQALAVAMEDNPLYQKIHDYVNELPDDEQAEIRAQLMDENLFRLDRIPSELDSLIGGHDARS